MSIFNSKNTPSIMKPITPDPSKNSFTEKISNTISSKKPTVTEQIATKLSGIKSLSQTFSPTESNSQTGSIMSTTNGGLSIIQMSLILIIILFLAYNVYLYFYEGTDILQKFFGITLFKTGKGLTNTIHNTGEGAKEVINVAEKGGKTVSKEIEMVGKDIEERSSLKSAIEKPKKKKEEHVIEDQSTESNIQYKKTKGYCYIGNDRGYRSCVKVNEQDNCTSGKVFPTKELCINPNIRQN